MSINVEKSTARHTEGQATTAGPLSSFTLNSIRFFAAGRAVIGTASFIAPEFTSQLLGLEKIPGLNIITRLFGGREIAMGGLVLFIASRMTESAQSKTELRRSVLAGAVADILDAVSCGLAFASGIHETGAVSLGLGGVFAASMGVLLARRIA